MSRPIPPRVEVRAPALPVALRAAPEGEDVPHRLAGYAAKFGVESSPLYDPSVHGAEFIEVIRRGAFARTLRENPDIRALYNHDTSTVLGRTANGSLRLREDEIGLAFEVDLPRTRAADDVRELVAAGYIDGCSFGFMVVDDEVEVRDGRVVRTLVEVELFEVSPAVAFPAYEDSEVAVRARRLARPRARARLAAARMRLRLLGLS